MEKKDYKALMSNLSLVTQLGLTMVGSILFCLAVGYYLDKWLGTRGIFSAVFIVLGILGGGYTVYRQIREVTDERRPDDTDGSGTKR